MAELTFGKDRRVRRRAEFLRIQAVGERASTAHFVLLVAAQAAQAKHARSRLGVVVTKKIGSAPVRSRIKRLCRECFRTFPELVPDGIDLVVIARDGAGELGLADVRDEWTRARPLLLKRCASALRGGGRASGPNAKNPGARPPADASSASKPAPRTPSKRT